MMADKQPIGLSDEGPFFHGTVADLRSDDLLTPGRASNYRPEVAMNHIYFTALRDGAGLAAEIASELAPDSRGASSMAGTSRNPATRRDHQLEIG